MSAARENTSERLRILVVRPDRVGDVILSTPVLEVLKKHFPGSYLCVLVREAVRPIVEGSPFVDEVMTYEPEGRHKGLGGFFRLISELRERNFRIGIVLQTQWRIGAALFGAGVRHRVGPLSKLHSFLFYNRGVRQRRSYVEMHETDYNLQLLRRLGIRAATRSVPVRVSVSDVAKESARKWFEGHGYTPGLEKPMIVIHPGMGGSALNWPENHFVELARALLKDGLTVLMTGGPTEGALLDRIRLELKTYPESQLMFYGGPTVGPIDHLAGLVSHAAVVVAPSTGPLHMAVALGKPVVTFYPPIRVQSAVRWGPYLGDETQASVLVPDVYCGQDFTCKGTLCNYFPCMKSMQVTQAQEQVNRHLSRLREPKIG